MTKRVDIDELRRLEREATPGPWQSMRRGNCALQSGRIEGQSLVVGPERPYCDVSLWQRTEEWARATVLRDDDADFVVAMRNALPTLLDELEAARAMLARLRNAVLLACFSALDDNDRERFAKLLKETDPVEGDPDG